MIEVESKHLQCATHALKMLLDELIKSGAPEPIIKSMLESFVYCNEKLRSNGNDFWTQELIDDFQMKLDKMK